MRLRIAIGRIDGLLGLTVCVLMCAGCALLRGPAQETPRTIGGAEAGQRITSAELDELTRAFADRYVGLLYSVCGALKKDNPDPMQRQEAQALLVDCATNVYDIASNADAFTRVLDLVVLTTLVSQVWVDDGRANAVFGQRGEALSRAMLHAQEEARALAARLLTAEQLNVLDALLRDWRAQNPEMTSVSFVRFSNFAIGRGRSAASELLAARGLFAQVEQAGQAVDEARLLGERMFYRLKREATLLRWQLAAAKDHLVATPEVASTLTNLDRLTNQFEQLPAHVAAEREAILAAVDSRMENVDTAVANVREVVAETKSLVALLEPTSRSLDDLFATVDALLARYVDWHQWAVGLGRRPFDIREYTQIVKESATTAQEWDELLESSSDLLASPDWGAWIDEWKRAADGRILMAADQSKSVLNDFFRRVYILLGVMFAMLILYRVITLLLMRRLRAATDERDLGRGANDRHNTDHNAGA